MAKSYVIKLSGDLYVASRFYNLYPIATDDINKAIKFVSIEDVENIAKGIIDSKIEELPEENNEFYKELENAYIRIGELEIELNKANKTIEELTEELEQYKQN